MEELNDKKKPDGRKNNGAVKGISREGKEENLKRLKRS